MDINDKILREIHTYQAELFIPSAFRYIVHQKNLNIENCKNIYSFTNLNQKQHILRDLNDLNNFSEFENKNKIILLNAVKSDYPVSKNLSDLIDYIYENAIKYACGRMTYIVSEAVEWTKIFSIFLKNETKNQMINYIQTKIDLNQAGMNCDIENWKQIITLLKHSPRTLVTSVMS